MNLTSVEKLVPQRQPPPLHCSPMQRMQLTKSKGTVLNSKALGMCGIPLRVLSSCQGKNTVLLIWENIMQESGLDVPSWCYWTTASTISDHWICYRTGGRPYFGYYVRNCLELGLPASEHIPSTY